MSAAASISTAIVAAMPQSSESQTKKSQSKEKHFPLSRVISAVRGQIFGFLSIQDRAQVHSVNRENRTLIEQYFYGKLDMNNKALCQQYLKERSKVRNELGKIEQEIFGLNQQIEALNKSLSDPQRTTLVILETCTNIDSLKASIKTLEEQRDKLTPIGVRYRAAMKRNRVDRKIMDLFGGRKKFEAIPVLVLEEKKVKGSICVLSKEMSAPIMRGVDKSGRVFVALKIQCKNPQNELEGLVKVEVIFQQCANEETWAVFGNSTFNIAEYLINEGRILGTNLEKYYVISRLIAKGHIEFETQAITMQPPHKPHL